MGTGMEPAIAAAAYRRLTGADALTLAGAVTAVGAETGDDPDRLLDALVLLRWVRAEVAAAEPRLITAARRAGVSWQALAPALVAAACSRSPLSDWYAAGGAGGAETTTAGGGG